MTRTILPARRPSLVQEFRFQGSRYLISIGYGPTGPAEIFVTAPKAGSALASVARDAAIAISIALQHGADLGVLARATTREEDGSPASVIGAALDAMLQLASEVAP